VIFIVTVFMYDAANDTKPLPVHPVCSLNQCAADARLLDANDRGPLHCSNTKILWRLHPYAFETYLVTSV